MPDNSLHSINISSPPTQVDYRTGKTFNPAGMVITANFTGNPPVLSDGDSSVIVSYSDSGVTKTAEQSIYCDSLRSIEITTLPDKLVYAPGQTFDATGMAVTATYASGATRSVTGYSFSPTSTLTDETTEITVSYA